MKIALAQLSYIPGDIRYNCNKIITAVEEAARQGAELVIFSEMALTGYPPKDLLLHEEMVAGSMSAAREIAQHCKGIAAIVGAPTPNMTRWGKELHNSALLLQEGEVRAVVSKSLLPTYDIFDESRYFRQGEGRGTVEINGMKIGITICEDIWDKHMFSERGRVPLYGFSPLDRIIEEQPDLIVNLAAIPFAHDRAHYREKVFRDTASRAQVPLIVVNQTGGYTDLVFDGSSVVAAPDGTLLERLAFCREEIRVVELPADERGYKKGDYEIPAPLPQEMTAHIRRALVTGISEFFMKGGFRKAVIGLSGGLDSAVVTALAAEALGNENVVALLMPSVYSSDHSVSDSVKMTGRLGITHHIVSIEEARQAVEKTVTPFFGDREPDTTEENIQPRLRAIILMAFANKLGYMLLNASNKSEMATGYSTLYGDMTGGLAVIGDLYKSEVYSLAAELNRQGEVIPIEIIEKPPSAELKPGQLDSDTLPPYNILDPVLYRHINLGWSSDRIIADGYGSDDVKRILKLVNNSQFKREQAPPILRVSSKAFGPGRRIPVISGYH